MHYSITSENFVYLRIHITELLLGSLISITFLIATFVLTVTVILISTRRRSTTARKGSYDNHSHHDPVYEDVSNYADFIMDMTSNTCYDRVDVPHQLHEKKEKKI